MDVLDTRSSNDSQLNDRSKIFLVETAKWANFLSILGFVFLGIYAVFGLFGLLGALIAGVPNAIFSMLLYFAFLAVGFFPCFYLFKASSGLKNGIARSDEDAITSGFENLKSHYKFLGIYTIVVLSLSLLLLIFGRALLFEFIRQGMMR